MKFDIRFTNDEIQITLTESLRFSEGQHARLVSPDGPAAPDLLPQIESLVQKYLAGYVVAGPIMTKSDLIKRRGQFVRSFLGSY